MQYNLGKRFLLQDTHYHTEKISLSIISLSSQLFDLQLFPNYSDKMNISFEGKRILVTGAEQGIGRAIALRLSKFGGKVIALSLNQRNLDTLSQEDPKIETVKADLSDWNETRNAVQGALPIHLLVNNAGVCILRPFLDAQQEDIDKCFDVNLKAIVNVSQIVAKSIVDAGKGGSIVNVSSKSSLCALENHAVYSSTKAGLDQLMRVMAVELGPHNIRVNSVNPTTVMTAMGRREWSDPEKVAKMTSKIPLRRFCELDEVVDAVVYLLSDKSSMINGVALAIDGGYSAT